MKHEEGHSGLEGLAFESGFFTSDNPVFSLKLKAEGGKVTGGEFLQRKFLGLLKDPPKEHGMGVGATLPRDQSQRA